MKLNKSILKSINKLNPNNEKCLLAFSGGPDSVYLLLQLAEIYKSELTSKIELAYVNYNDSEYVSEEQKIVEFYKNKFNLKLHFISTNYNQKFGNFEEWARNFRYDFFQSIISTNNLFGLYTAHQQTDDIETYLMQQERNNLPILFGLNAITILNNFKVLRPMLDVSKSYILNELKNENVLFYDDCTNYNLKKVRNLCRLKLNNISKKEQARILLEKQARNKTLEDLYKSFSSQTNPYKFDFYYSLNSDSRKRFCYYIIKQHYSMYKNCLVDKNPNFSNDFYLSQAHMLYYFLQNNKTSYLKLDDILYVYKFKNFFILSKNLDEYSFQYTINKPSIINIHDLKINLQNLNLFSNLLSFPLVIRSANIDDYIDTNLKEKSVKNFLTKQGIPVFLFPLYPVFECNNKVLYVPFKKDIIDKKIPIELLNNY